MKNRNLIVLIIISFLLFGCDPALVLIIEAGKTKDTSVTIYTDETFFPYEKRNKDEKTIIRVPWTDSINNYKKEFYFGIGAWSDKMVSDLSQHIDSIVLKSNSDILSINKKTDIENYLLKHRSRFIKNKITIKAQ